MKYRVQSNHALGAGDFHLVTLVPVTEPPVPENQEVWRLNTPNGEWFLTEINPEAAAELQPDREFWVELTAADS
jgi:hypothetical protein